jgi:hypothetical protein
LISLLALLLVARALTQESKGATGAAEENNN